MLLANSAMIHRLDINLTEGMLARERQTSNVIDAAAL